MTLDASPALRARLFVLLFVVLGVVAFPRAVFAQDPVGPAVEADSLFDLDPFTVNLLLGAVIPLLVALVTKVSTHSGVKAVLLALLSAVAGAIQVATTDGGGAVFSEATLKSAALTFVIAVATHFGLLKPTTVTAKVQAVGVKD